MRNWIRTITRTRTPRPKGGDCGFTLIELMVVVAIIGGVVVLSMPYLSNRNTQTKAVLRELSVLSRELHTRAKLQGVVYRLVIDLGAESKNGQVVGQSFWVEKANGQTVIKTGEEEAALKRAEESDPEKKKDPKGFEVDRTFVKHNHELPRGMTFDKVELTRSPTPITHGKAFIHYLPAGLVDEAAIHMKGEKGAEWTIAIHPLTGKAEVISKILSLKEIKSQ